MPKSRLHTLSLAALRTFEVAARFLSFKKAAGELSVTPAAVSQGIRTLENQLGLRLFERSNRALRLTEAGALLARNLGPVFERIEEILSQLPPDRDAPDRRDTLHLDVLPSFAVKFLATRLADFHGLHPGVGLSIEASDHLSADGINRGFDLAIRYGRGPYPGVRAEPLIFGGKMVAVCAPHMIEEARRALEGSIQANAPLIHTSRPEDGDPDISASWPSWFRTHGIRLAGSLDCYPSFSNAHLAIDAAIDGQGVLLAPFFLLADDLKAGRLALASEKKMTDPSTLWLVQPAEGRSKSAAQGFIDWLTMKLSIALGPSDE